MVTSKAIKNKFQKLSNFKKKKNVLLWKKEFNILTANYEAFRVVSCWEVGFMTHKSAVNLKNFIYVLQQMERQAWANCSPDADRVRSGAHILLCKKNSFDLQISSQIDKIIKKLQWIPNTIVSTNVLAIFWCLHIWWCQKWFIYSWIEKYLINCLH